MVSSPIRAEILQAMPSDVAVWTQEAMNQQMQAAISMKAAVDAAIARGEKEISIPSGQYRFHPDHLKQFLLRDISDVTIHAEGVTFWLFPFQREDGVLFERCRNVKLSGLTVDYYPTAYPQGRITGIDAAKGFIDLQLDGGYSTPGDVPGGVKNAKVVYFTPAGDFIETRLDWVERAEELSKGNWRVWPRSGWAFRKYQTEVKPGMVLAIAGRTMRMAFNLKDSDACALEGITAYASPHMVFTEHFGGGGHVYRNCRVVRRPGTNRMLACNADIFHSIGVTKGPRIEGCEFSHSADDIINIHGLMSLVLHQRRGDSIDLVSQLNPTVPPGTTLRFYDAETLQMKGEARVVESRSVDIEERVTAAQQMVTDLTLHMLKPLRVVRVQLDREVKVSPHDFVTDDARTARDTVIRENHFHDCYTRGVLLKSDGGLIEGNLIENMGISSIGIAIDPKFMEGPFPSRIKIIDNTIKRNGFVNMVSRDGWNYLIGAISVVSEMERGLSPHTAVTDIEIIDNTITGSVTGGIFLANVERGVVEGNTIVRAAAKAPFDLGSRMGLDKPLYALLIAESRKIRVSGNKFEDTGSSAAGDFSVFGGGGDIGPQQPVPVPVTSQP